MHAFVPLKLLCCQWLSWRGNDNWRVGLQNCGGTAVGAWVPESSLLERSRDGQCESLTNAEESRRRMRERERETAGYNFTYRR